MQGCRSWHLPPGLPKQPSTPDTALSSCPAMNQCHRGISSSIWFICHISGCKWKLQPPPSVRTAGSQERRGSSRSLRQGPSQDTALATLIHRKPVACEGAQLESFAWKANECHGPSLAPVKRVSFPLCSTLLPSPCLCFFWIQTFLSTSVNTHCGKLPWEHHFLVDLPLS